MVNVCTMTQKSTCGTLAVDMPVVDSEYWVRVKVTENMKGTRDNAYYAALALARDLASKNPGLTFEVAEDKVWGRTTRRISA